MNNDLLVQHPDLDIDGSISGLVRPCAEQMNR